jgi:hypothetical protein
MASHIYNIATAVKTVISGVNGVPTNIDIRKKDSPHVDDCPILIITLGDELEPSFQVMGGGVSGDYGTVGKRYLIGISIYTKNLGDLSTDVDDHPALVLRIKQAIDQPLNTGGVPESATVWNTELKDHPEWEQQEFSKGVEVSRFALIFESAEARNS